MSCRLAIAKMWRGLLAGPPLEVSLAANT